MTLFAIFLGLRPQISNGDLISEIANLVLVLVCFSGNRIKQNSDTTDKIIG